MPLITLQEALSQAVGERYAVGSFNVTNHDFVEAVMAAAEERNVPVIISVAEVHLRYLNLEHFIPYVKQRISHSPVPAVLHLDHGTKKETLVQALHYGFSSLMFDGSMLSLEENTRQTREIVEMAHMAGVSVEAELGHVSGGEGNFEGGSRADTSLYTDPSQAEAFVRDTGVDALAVAIGTVHGPYLDEPDLDLARLEAIRERTAVPLVLHGGSGLSDRDFREAIARGINKVNFYTDSALKAVEAVQERLRQSSALTYPDLAGAARSEIRANTLRQIELFGTKPLPGPGEE